MCPRIQDNDLSLLRAAPPFTETRPPGVSPSASAPLDLQSIQSPKWRGGEEAKEKEKQEEMEDGGDRGGEGEED